MAPRVDKALAASVAFAATFLIGTGMGWLIDYVADSGPCGLIIGILCGFVAATINGLYATR
jgi:F0F1-type ATP synthase assembly protein I